MPILQLKAFDGPDFHAENLNRRFIRNAFNAVEGDVIIVLRTEMDVPQHQNADHEDGHPGQHKKPDLAFGRKMSVRRGIAVSHRLSVSFEWVPAPTPSQTA